MSGGSKKLLQRWLLSQPLPYLKQGSTLSIRSHLKTDLRIRSHWRDDGQLSFVQHCHVPQHCDEIDHNASAHILLSRNEDKMTSLGREDPHVSIDVLDKHRVEELTPDNGTEIDSKRTTTMISPSPPTIITEDEEEGNCLTLDVPDKINIDCDLTEGGSIFVDSKIEGDVRLKTAQGNITVKKLRGHKIDLETASLEGRKQEQDTAAIPPSFIFVSEVLESQSLRLVVPRPSVDRIRAKRIHANTMEIRAGGEEVNGSTASTLNPPSSSSSSVTNENDDTRQHQALFDEDDSGAICDISSLYIIGDATVDVQQSGSVNDQHYRQRQAVRIKSHHGHVHVQASAPKPDNNNDVTGDVLPLVDLGGVNGSCEVWVSRPQSDDDDDNDDDITATNSADDDWTSCHVHFDSIAPDSVSLLHADEGSIHVTVDRKVESDVRLLSPPLTANVDTETLLLEDNEDGSLADEVSHMLQEMEDNAAAATISGNTTLSTSSGTSSNRIKIETQAFTSRERNMSNQLRHCEFVDGWIENTTSEPDSRFDRKIRGNSGGGKIRQDGAQNQALYGFVTDKGGAVGMTEPAFARPLLAVSSPGKIVLETLSWLGNIARRYGLDDSRKEDDLGRQATRRKGLGREIPTDE